MSQKIVFIDSDVSFSSELRAGLEGAGYEVTALADGKTAIDFVRDVRPDVIFLSVELMAGQSGYIICGRLKKDEELCHVPLILGAHDTSGFEQHQRLKARADAYLQKPFDAAALLQVIAQVRPGGEPEVVAQTAEMSQASQDREVDQLFERAFDETARLMEPVEPPASVPAREEPPGELPMEEPILLDLNAGDDGHADPGESGDAIDAQAILESAPFIVPDDADAQVIDVEPLLEPEEVLEVEPVEAETFAEGDVALMKAEPSLEAAPVLDAEPILEPEEILDLEPLAVAEPLIEAHPTDENVEPVEVALPESEAPNAQGLTSLEEAVPVLAEEIASDGVEILDADQVLDVRDAPPTAESADNVEVAASDIAIEEAPELQQVPVLHFPEMDEGAAPSVVPPEPSMADAPQPPSVDRGERGAEQEDRPVEAVPPEAGEALRMEQIAHREEEIAGSEAFAALCAERDALQRDLEAARADLDVLRPECGQAKIDLDAVHADMESLRAELESVRAEREGCLAERDALQGELSTARTEAAAASAEIAGVRAELDAVRAELESVRAEREGCLAERDALQGELSTARTEATAASAEIAGVRAELDAVRAELESVRAEREGYLAERDALQGELAAAKASAQQAQEGSDARIAELSAEREALRTQVEDLEASLALSEERAGKNYQKLRNDEQLRAKARKALDVAIALMAAAESVPIAPLPDEREQGELAVRSLEGMLAEATAGSTSGETPREAEGT